MANKLHTSKHLQNVANRFCNLKTVGELAVLLKITVEKLQTIFDALDGGKGVPLPYKTLRIPKAEGKERLIEDATGDLKKIQKTLNMYLEIKLFIDHSMYS